MVMKAIHLEVASDYSTAAFLAAFHRFIARRGTPTDMYSDHGTNFIGAQREIAAAFSNIMEDVNFKNHKRADSSKFGPEWSNKMWTSRIRQ